MKKKKSKPRKSLKKFLVLRKPRRLFHDESIHSIRSKHLSKDQYKFLKYHDYIKFISDNLHAVTILLKVNDHQKVYDVKKRVFFNPYEEFKIVSGHKEIINAYNTEEWSCAICLNEIQINVTEFKVSSFVCGNCTNYLKDKYIDRRIYDSLISFADFAKDKLTNEQKKFLKYIKQNKNKNK